MGCMRILLLASRPEDAQAVEASLLDDGHTVASCQDADGGPCRGLRHHGLEHHEGCPLESSVDVAVIARSHGTEPTMAEMGAVCAARHRVGVIRVDPADPRTDSLYELADAAERAVCAAYEASIRLHLARAQPEAPEPIVSVTRHDTDVQVSLVLDRQIDRFLTGALADRARAAVRDYDPYARVIDIVVVPPS
jgi:hypothetical protein